MATALTVTWYWRGALHWAVVPPLLPAQSQLKVVVALVTLLGVPVLHRLALGAALAATALALPQTPVIGRPTGVTELDGADSAPVPALLVAVTVKV